MHTARDRKRRLPVADFLDGLEARLDAMKPAELRAALMTHAEHLPPSERRSFLDIFDGRGKAGEAGQEKRPKRAPKADTLSQRLKNVMEPEGPCLFMFNNCRQFVRTVPSCLATRSTWMTWTARRRIRCGGLGFALGTKGRTVPQPLRASLFLRNQGHWKCD